MKPTVAFTTLAATSLALSACVTARMHTEAELNGVGRQCGLALGELFQDESEKRLLFMIRHGATAQERACVLRWARERHLRLSSSMQRKCWRADDDAARLLSAVCVAASAAAVLGCGNSPEPRRMESFEELKQRQIAFGRIAGCPIPSSKAMKDLGVADAASATRLTIIRADPVLDLSPRSSQSYKSALAKLELDSRIGWLATPKQIEATSLDFRCEDAGVGRILR